MKKYSQFLIRKYKLYFQRGLPPLEITYHEIIGVVKRPFSSTLW